MKLQFQYSTKMVLLGTAAWLVFWTFVQTLVLHRLDLEWRSALIDAGVSNILLVVMCYAAIMVYRFYQPGKKNRIYRFIYAFGISILFCLSLRFVLSAALKNETEYLDFLEKSLPLRFISALMIISFVTMLNWMWNSMKDQKEQEERRNETEKLVKEAELVRLSCGRGSAW